MQSNEQFLYASLHDMHDVRAYASRATLCHVLQAPPCVCASRPRLCKAPKPSLPPPWWKNEHHTKQRTISVCMTSWHARCACICIKSHLMHVLQAPPCAWASRPNLCNAPKPPPPPPWRKNARHVNQRTVSVQWRFYLGSTPKKNSLACMYIYGLTCSGIHKNV